MVISHEYVRRSVVRVEVGVLGRASSSRKRRVIEKTRRNHSRGAECGLVKLVPCDSVCCSDHKSEKNKVGGGVVLGACQAYADVRVRMIVLYVRVGLKASERLCLSSLHTIVFTNECSRLGIVLDRSICVHATNTCNMERLSHHIHVQNGN